MEKTQKEQILLESYFEIIGEKVEYHEIKEMFEEIEEKFEKEVQKRVNKMDERLAKEFTKYFSTISDYLIRDAYILWWLNCLDLDYLFGKF